MKTMTDMIESNRIYRNTKLNKSISAARDFFQREKDLYLKSGMDDDTFRRMWNVANGYNRQFNRRGEAEA